MKPRGEINRPVASLFHSERIKIPTENGSRRLGSDRIKGVPRKKTMTVNLEPGPGRPCPKAVSVVAGTIWG